MLPLLTQCDVLSTSADDVECFARKLFSKSPLDLPGGTLHVFPLTNRSLLCGMHINLYVFSAIIS